MGLNRSVHVSGVEPARRRSASGASQLYPSGETVVCFAEREIVTVYVIRVCAGSLVP